MVGLGAGAERPLVVVDLGQREVDVHQRQQIRQQVAFRRGQRQRRAAARGRDIYAITAPIVVEAAERILTGRTRATGVITAGEGFDAEDFLRALPLDDVSWDAG